MAVFSATFIHTLKQFLCKRNWIILLILIFTALALLQIGIQKSKMLAEQEVLFNNLEKEKISEYLNYRFYGIYGMRLLFSGSPFSIFELNSSIINDLKAFIDSGERLNIDIQFIGRNMFKQKKFGFMDFSGVFFYLFTLVFCFYGLEMAVPKEYLKTYNSLCGKRASFFSLLLSRLLIIGIVIAVILGLAFIQALLNGIILPIGRHFLVFYLEILGLSFFFFLLGNALGRIKQKAISVIFIVISWVVIIFVLPTLVNGITETRADTLEPQYELALKKLKKFTDFEKMLRAKEGNASNGKVITDSIRQEINKYKSTVFQEILSMELSMYEGMMGTARFYHTMSMFFPSTHYISVTEELSSMGYLNLLDFYKRTIELKARFVPFILDKIYFENFTEIVPFLKEGENVYHASPRVPGTFLAGSVINLFYLLVLVFVDYRLYKRTIFETCEPSAKVYDKLEDIRLDYGRHYTFQVRGRLLLNRLYNIFSGNRVSGEMNGTAARIYLGQKDITGGDVHDSFLYVCSPKELPGEFAARDFYRFLVRITRCPKEKSAELARIIGLEDLGTKKVSNLNLREKASLLLALVLMTERSVYVFHDIVRGQARAFTERFKAMVEELTARGALVVYLTEDTSITEYRDERNWYEDQTSFWNSQVDQYKEKR